MTSVSILMYISTGGGRTCTKIMIATNESSYDMRARIKCGHPPAVRLYVDCM